MVRGSISGVNRIMRRMIAAAAIAATGAFTPLPPPIDAAMAERAVTGAEWLAARAAKMPEPVDDAEDEIDLTNWLIAASGADSINYQAFADYLSTNGYGDSRYAVQDWTDEITLVLAASEAARKASQLRTVEEIEAEINTLPSLPLDAAGEAERDRLMEELDLASIPEEQRRAAAQFAVRIAALRMLYRAEAEQ